MYYGGNEVTCYNSRNNVVVTCPTTSLNSIAKEMIDNHTWNTGGIKYETVTDTLSFYAAERGTLTGKTCTSEIYCNDTVTRTTSWTGYVALPYVTDYAYASSESVCKTNIQSQDSSNNYVCKNNNWMHRGSTMNEAIVTLSPFGDSSAASYVWRVHGIGCSRGDIASNPLLVFPTVYLKSNVKVAGGTGTSTDPYILSRS